jgi:hypothetical protein
MMEAEWKYLSEGKNHVIYTNNRQILRIRKICNVSYYTDPLQYDEVKYNQLFLEHVLCKNEVLRKYVKHSKIISIDSDFLQKLQKPVDGQIDYNYRFG